MTSHGISPKGIEKFETEDPLLAAGAVHDPKRLAAVKAIGLLDTLPTPGFDRITRLGELRQAAFDFQRHLTPAATIR